MSGWLLVIVLIAESMSGEPRIVQSWTSIEVDEAACLKEAGRAREALEPYGHVAASCDPVASMPFIKRRGTKT